MKEFINFNSSGISWFRCGGNIDVFCIAENFDDILQITKKYKQLSHNILPIGAGSNILIRDAGYKGIAIKLSGKFNEVSLINNNQIKAGCGVFSKNLCDFALKNNLIGCEFLNTIPGTVGGMIKMNAGCFGKEIKDILLSADVFIDNKILTLTKEDLKYSYRHSELPQNAIILSAIFKLTLGSNKDVLSSQEIIKNMQEQRTKNQIIGATCGSTFKNIIDSNGNIIYAWKLIEDVNLRGFQIGGAKFSEKHCNFIINNGNATATDIENLINLAKQRIKEKFNIEMQTEIQII